jgi:hypothetical protein
MFNSVVLEVVIGLVFIYLLYSLLATIIQEIIATNFGFRAKILERAIIRMLEDGYKFRFRIHSIIDLFRQRKRTEAKVSPTTLFYRHPLIRYLAEDRHHSKPAYINKGTFSKVIIDLLRGYKVKPGMDIRPLIQKSLDEGKTEWGRVDLDPQTLIFLHSIWADADGEIEKFKALIESWFTETMDRASGWYKRYTQVVLLFVGLSISVIFNVDTLEIVNKLEKDPKIREQMVQQADNFVKAHPNLDEDLQQAKIQHAGLLETIAGKNMPHDSIEKQLDEQRIAAYEQLKIKRDSLMNAANQLIKEDIDKVNNLLGQQIWSYKWKGWTYFFQSLFGWLITALALSLGAPFWFDLLNKLMKLRSSVANAANGKVVPKKIKTSAEPAQG